MGCCASKGDADATPTEAPVRQRKLHNFCWIVLFIAGVIFSGIVTWKAKNDPHFSPIYQNGVDSWGNICGQDVQDHEYGYIEKWDGGFMGNQAVGYPVLNSENTFEVQPTYVMERKNTTKVYNSGFPKHGINLCLNTCPGASLPDEIYDSTESLQKLGTLYMAGSAEDFSELMFDTMAGNSFPDIPLATIKNSLWCEKVATENGYDSLELCNEQKVMMPSSTILHMCTPHYKIALAVAQASMSAQSEINDQQTARNENKNSTSDATYGDMISEAGNAVMANKRTIFYCFLGAMFIAAAVILIIQIFTKYLIYTVVVAFFVSALIASASVWYSYLQVANPEFLSDNGIPTDLGSTLCNQTQRAMIDMRSQKLMDNDMRFANLDGASNTVVLDARFFQNINKMDTGSGSNNVIPDLADSIDSITDSLSSFQERQARVCNTNGTTTGNTEEQEKEIQQRLYIAITVSVICFLIILVICCNCGNIRLAVNLFDEAGTCVFAIPGILFQPIWTMLILMAVMSVCVSQFLYVCQVFVPVVVPDGQANAGQVMWFYKSFVSEYTWVYTFFITVWVWYFIDGCHQVTLAGAVNNWYWGQSESSILPSWFRCWNRLKCCPGSRAFCDLLKFSLGSVALGSLLVALIATVRVIVKLIQIAGKRAAGGKETKFTKILFACIQCLLACIQKFVEFINKNGYIGIAIFGYDFCRAAQKCLALKVENAGRAMMLFFICRFVLTLGKVCSVVGSCLMCKTMLDGDKTSEDMPMHSLVAIYGCVAIFSYWITGVFLSVYDLTLDTIFLCFCEDQQRNNGRDRPYKSSAKLQKFMRENA